MQENVLTFFEENDDHLSSLLHFFFNVPFFVSRFKSMCPSLLPSLVKIKLLRVILLEFLN